MSTLNIFIAINSLDDIIGVFTDLASAKKAMYEEWGCKDWTYNKGREDLEKGTYYSYRGEKVFAIEEWELVVDSEDLTRLLQNQGPTPCGNAGTTSNTISLKDEIQPWTAVGRNPKTKQLNVKDGTFYLVEFPSEEEADAAHLEFVKNPPNPLKDIWLGSKSEENRATDVV